MTFIETFNPQSDITALELALGMDMLRQYFFSGSINKNQFDALPANVQRHFTIRTLGEDSGDGDGGDAS